MKAAFTRAYNKEVHLTPYSLQTVKKGRRGGGGESELGEDDVNQAAQESEDEGENLKADAMIKVFAFGAFSLWTESHVVFIVWILSLQQKKAKATKEMKKETKKDKEDHGKGKGKGKGKAKKWERSCSASHCHNTPVILLRSGASQ